MKVLGFVTVESFSLAFLTQFLVLHPLETSVAEPKHFSSAPAPDIFFWLAPPLKAQLRQAPSPPVKARLRPAPATKNRFIYKTFEKSKF